MNSKTLLKIAAFTALVCLPFLAHYLYRSLTALPTQITIATGPANGRYRIIGESLAREIESKLNISVRLIHTQGSLDNMRLLESGEVDFALYQPGTQHILTGRQTADNSVAFVTNVYSEVAHFIVRRGAAVKTPADLNGKRVAMGQRNSGDYAMAVLLLQHFGVDNRTLDMQYSDYGQIKTGFLDGSLDAAFITAGIQAPVFEQLFATGKCDLLSIPYAEALSTRHISISRYRIPAGLYRSFAPVEPATDIETVALRAELLTRTDIPTSLVEQVTAIVLGEDFLKTNRLAELFTEGRDFASRKPEFSIHPGAQSFFDPELRPLLNPDFVEATEGMRSFVVSILITAFLAIRWLKDRRDRRNDHRLDRYIRSLLDIERRQIRLDDGSSFHDLAGLQNLLDEVTELRQDALRDFSAHELNEDRAVDCFLEMCHALSDKLNAKITRQRLERRLHDMAEAFRKVSTTDTTGTADTNEQPEPGGADNT